MERVDAKRGADGFDDRSEHRLVARSDRRNVLKAGELRGALLGDEEGEGVRVGGEKGVGSGEKGSQKGGRKRNRSEEKRGKSTAQRSKAVLGSESVVW